jgi:hypothetical protein
MAASPECSTSGKPAASAARVPPACSQPSRRAACSSAARASRSPADAGSRQRSCQAHTHILHVQNRSLI